MKRVIALICALFLLLSTVACNKVNTNTLPANGNKSTQESSTIFGADLHGNGGGQLFDKNVLSIPDIGVYLRNALYLDEGQILLCGTNQEGEYWLYSMGVSDFSINPLSDNLGNSIIDICTDRAGVAYTLSQDENGSYIINSFCSGNQTVCVLTAPEGINEEVPLWEIIKAPHGFLIASAQYVFAFADDGSYIKKYGPYFGAISLISDGEKPLICTSLSNEAGTTIYAIDESFNITSTYNLAYSYSMFYDGNGGVIFAESANTIYSLDYSKDSRDGFVNVLASGGGANSFTILDNYQFISIEKGLPVIWTLSNGKKSTVSIKLAAYNPDIYLVTAVSAFNEASTDVKIDLVDYSVYDEAGGTATGLTRLKTDIISGNTPDIYDLSNLPSDSYAEKGLLEDLKPYFLREQEVAYSDIVDSIAVALENNGCIYDFIPSFYIVAMCGDSQVVGSTSGWTIDEFLEFAQNYTPTELFGPDMTKYAFLQLILAFGESKFFNYETATCNFNNEKFVEVLNYSKLLPDQSVDDGYQDEARAYCGYQKLLFGTWGEYLILDVLINNAIFADRTNYIGFPSSVNSGIAALPVIHLGISSSSAEKESAWSFFQFLLSENYQSSFMELNGKEYKGRWQLPGIPVVKKNLDKRVDYWMSMYSEKPAELGTFSGGSVIIIEGKTANETTRAEAMALIEKVSCIYKPNEEIYSIIMEVSMPFFAGDKTAEEVANLIQSRVSIYLAEQYG